MTQENRQRAFALAVDRATLVERVTRLGESHNFRESGGSRVLSLGGDSYRLTLPAGKLSWFAYDLATGKQTLIGESGRADVDGAITDEMVRLYRGLLVDPGQQD